MIGQRIRAARELAKLRQADVAAILGVTRNTVARWERGESTPTGLYRAAAERWVTKMEGER